MGQITSQSAQGGTYKFLRCHEQDGQLRVLFRLLTPEGGLNYHDLVVRKYSDSVRVADIYVAVSGELLSKTMRQLYVSSLAADRPSFLSKQNDHDADLANSVNKLAGDDRRDRPITAPGDRHLRRSPRKRPRRKVVPAVRLKAASARRRRVSQGPGCLSPVSSRRSMPRPGQYRSLLPGETIRQGPGSRRSHRKVVGGDPYLNIFRANAYFAQDKVDDALRLARKASAGEKDLKIAYETELGITLAARNSPTWPACCRSCKRDFHVPVEDLVEDPQYADFKASKEYATWKKAGK